MNSELIIALGLNALAWGCIAIVLQTIERIFQ